MRYLMFLLLLSLTACTTVKPTPELFNGAERAIQFAESQGAEEHAPLELRFAREKLAAARQAEDQRDYDLAMRMAEQAEIDAELASARSRAAIVRAEVSARQQANDELKRDIRENFGEER